MILHRINFNSNQSDEKSDKPGFLGLGRPLTLFHRNDFIEPRLIKLQRDLNKLLQININKRRNVPCATPSLRGVEFFPWEKRRKTA